MEIIFEDDHLVVVDKPAGLLSVPGKTAEKYDSVQSRLREHYLGITAIHRLDMATSGLILFAKHKVAERFYKQQFELRQVQKSYIAICHGSIKAESGSISFPLLVDWPNRPRQRINYALGKHALTYFKVLDESESTTRVLLHPHTGRSHQLRVHMASVGHAIVGDKLYADACDQSEKRLYLHSQSIQIKDFDGRRLILEKSAEF